jgi:hypothetical protein
MQVRCVTLDTHSFLNDGSLLARKATNPVNLGGRATGGIQSLDFRTIVTYYTMNHCFLTFVRKRTLP